MVVLNDVFLFWPPNFSFSDDFFNKNGVYQLCFRQSKLIDCTIWYHSNGAVVWCLRLKSQNGAVVDGTIVVFYGTSDRLDIHQKRLKLSYHVQIYIFFKNGRKKTENGRNIHKKGNLFE